jgi:hypothetical protein
MPYSAKDRLLKSLLGVLEDYWWNIGLPITASRHPIEDFGPKHHNMVFIYKRTISIFNRFNC